MHAVRYEGPLPQAAELQEYERALPGLADRIVALAEREAAARHEIMRVEAKFALRGQLLAFTIMLAALGLAGFALFKGFEGAAIAIVGTTLGAGTLVALISGRRKDKKAVDE